MKQKALRAGDAHSFYINEIPNPIFQQEIITEYLHKIRNLYTIFILKILSLIYKTGEEKQ